MNILHHPIQFLNYTLIKGAGMEPCGAPAVTLKIGHLERLFDVYYVTVV